MSIEKRVLLASVLSAVLIILYGQAMSRLRSTRIGSQAEPRRAQPEAALVASPANLLQPISEEEVINTTSEVIGIEVGRETASVRSVILHEFKDLRTGGTLRFGGTYPVISVEVGEDDTKPTLVRQETSPEWHGQLSQAVSYALSLELESHKPLLTIDVALTNGSDVGATVPITIVVSWTRGDELSGAQNPLEITLLSKKTHPWQREYLRYPAGLKRPQSVLRGTSFVTLSDRHFCQAVQTDPSMTRVTLFPAPEGTVAARIETDASVPPNGTTSHRTTFYLGARDFFRLKEVGFEKSISLGLFGQIGLVLIMILKFLASVTHNYGVAIICLSGLITLVLAPFTLIGLRSMKKLQELQPKIEKVMKQHKDDPKRANQEMMALYREHRVSPLSGCFPMLLQFPVLIALFQAISHVIEIRGAKFLWINDLSLPDRLARLPVSIPFLGSDLNILPIIMAVVMFFQTKLSQPQMPTGSSNPSMKWMSGPLMPVLFGVMFYHFPSSLVLYWLTNSLMSLLWYRLAKA